SRENLFHPVHARDVTLHGMIAAVLPGTRAESATREARACSGTADMDHRGQILLLPQRRRADAMPVENGGDLPIQVSRCHLHRVRWNHTHVETVEPAGVEVVPWPVL